jgi:hypothetical protein
MLNQGSHLYFHSPCFDGLISAVLLSDHLRTTTAGSVELHPVNYDLNDTWETLRLEMPAAVVDFLYHPDASIWFDHHATTFISRAFERSYQTRKDSLIVYDRNSRSCSMLIWKAELRLSGDHFHKVLAADLIDSADYKSPEEAVFGDTPAMRINASFAVGETAEYSKSLVELLLHQDLERVAKHPLVRERYVEYVRRRDIGMQRFKPTSDLRYSDGFRVDPSGVVLFAVDASDGIVSRYAPFTVAPSAAYSLGLMLFGDDAKITAMRNPWRNFQSVPLGEIFSRFGGGGHQRVASTRLHGQSRDQAVETLFRVQQALQSAIVHQARGAPA